MKVLDDKYIRMRMPLLFTIVMWLLFDRYMPWIEARRLAKDLAK